MMCEWKELLNVLPPRLRREVDFQGRQTLQELRLRLGALPELNLGGQQLWLKEPTVQEDIQYILSAATQYSPWAAATMAKGYLTIPGGHRIGLCGEVICRDGRVEGLREIDSMCIRIARDFPGIAPEPETLSGSVLILGPPGWGKTTLLRDLSRKIAQREQVAVIDERGELFPAGMQRGIRMDVLRLCPKKEGILMALRTMGPEWIAVDEITQPQDTAALIQAANCGVRLLATVHAADCRDLQQRSIFRTLLGTGIFNFALVLKRDKSFSVERMGI